MNRPTRSVLYPGSFDPIHLGHVDVVEQAADLFGDVVVVVMQNPEKPSGLFSVERRMAMIAASIAHVDGARVETAAGLAVDAARTFNVDFIVKGLRNATDFEFEQQMAHTNRSVTGVRTVYLPSRPDQGFLSSRFIREIAQYGGDVSHLVPPAVVTELAGMFPAAPQSPKARG